MTETATQRTGRITVQVEHHRFDRMDPTEGQQLYGMVVARLGFDLAQRLVDLLSDGRPYLVQWGSAHDLPYNPYSRTEPFSFPTMELSALVQVADVNLVQVGEYVPEHIFQKREELGYWFAGPDRAAWEFRYEHGQGWQRVA